MLLLLCWLTSQVLGDIEIAQKMLEGNEAVSAAEEVDHPDDQNYQSLKAGLRTLDRSSHEFKVLTTYLDQTMGTKLELMDIWGVDREGEVCGVLLLFD